MKTIDKFFIVLGISILITMNSIIGFAQKADSVKTRLENWDRFSVSLGGFMAGYNSGITLASGQLGLGVQIDIEDALGLNTNQFAFRGSAIYRFGKKLKHSASVGYFGIARNSRKFLNEELELGDNVFPIGTEINSKFDLTILRAKYDYAFFQDDRVSLGASFGLFIMPVNFSVQANNNNEQKAKFTAPLPLLGLRSDFRINKKLYLNQSVEILYLSVSNFTGSILDLNVAVEHKTFEHIAFGIGVNANKININIENEDSPIKFFGDIKMDYTGLLFYAKYNL